MGLGFFFLWFFLVGFYCIRTKLVAGCELTSFLRKPGFHLKHLKSEGFELYKMSGFAIVQKLILLSVSVKRRLQTAD